MAGTLSEQATLAADAAFVAKVKAAMIFRAITNFNSATAQTFATLEQCRQIIKDGGGDSQRVAWLCAVGVPSIAAAAPAVPSDAATQTAVDLVLSAMIK